MNAPVPSPGPHREVERVSADQRIWFISDLHLGDGTPSDAFFGKDQHLIALIERVEEEGALLVVNGDAVDFQQAWSFLRILRAHQALFRAMSRLAHQGRLIYVIGNHDYDITLFRDVLSFRVCHEVHVGDQILVRHGYEYDPYISAMLDEGQWHTVLHHMVERYLGTWIRIPLSEFYTVPNRVFFWTLHKLGLMAKGVNALGARLGREGLADEALANLDVVCWSNGGDSMGIFRPAFTHARTGPWRTILCGHSHVPGMVRDGDRTYANTGSWTFASSQYILWDGRELVCRDWLSGRRYGDELYQRMLDGTLYEYDFFRWWDDNYLGWLRFRDAEARRHRLSGWESAVRDRQLRAQVGRHRPAPHRPDKASQHEAAE